MTCKDFLLLYSAYRDGANPRLAAAMEAHLAVCTSCEAHDQAVRRGVDALRREVILPSEDFAERLDARLASNEEVEEPFRPHVSPVVASAMAVLLLALAVFTSHRPAMVSTAAAQVDPPSVARPVATAGIPFVAFVPGP